jgi:hypothetical protein
MGKRTNRPQKRWRPLERAAKIAPTPERIDALRREALALGMDPSRVDGLVEADREMWMNDRYTVTVRRHDEGWIRSLSVRRNDRGPDIPWRDLQRIKSELAGDEAEAVELFPAESRLVDTANQRWLWCLPPGARVPIGWEQGRIVGGPEGAARVGARLSPLDR